MSAPTRVLFVVIDGMAVEAFEQATSSGRAPALAFLKERGTYVREAVSVFPSITPAATAALVTGATPDAHGIPGMCWYDRDAERFVNYGQSPRAALVEGMTQILVDTLCNLNARHLSPGAQTIHEQLDDLGLVTASVNYLVFRGRYAHEPRLKPALLRMLLDASVELPTVYGPQLHYLADVVGDGAEACGELLSPRSVKKRLKVTDAWAACVTRELLERRAADFVLFYLHENDHHSHAHGPAAQVESVAEADSHIAFALDAFPSWEEALAEYAVVVTADHAQSPVSGERDHVFALEDVLADFSQVRQERNEREPFGANDLACAGNGRVGFVYLNGRRRRKLLPAVVQTLRGLPGVDQILWRDGSTYVVESPRGRLLFREADAGGVRDERDCRWELEGELAAVGAVLEGGRVVTPEYPLAFWRLRHGLDLARIGDVVVTPKLTWEIKDLGGGDHRGGGDHASLHAQDSLVPFVSTLPDAPQRLTIADVTPHVVEHFHRLGA